MNLINEGGFGVSRVAAFLNFSPGVSGFTFKSCGFSGFEICHRLRVSQIFVLGFRFSFKTSYFSGFPSHTVHVVYLDRKNQLWNAQIDARRFSEKETGENTQRLLTKIEDFCSVLQVRVLAFFTSGFSGFSKFWSGFAGSV